MSICVDSLVPGASIVGVSVRRFSGAALRTGFQENPSAAEFPGTVGGVVGRGCEPGVEATRRKSQLSQGSTSISSEVVILQVKKEKHACCIVRFTCSDACCFFVMFTCVVAL